MRRFGVVLFLLTATTLCAVAKDWKVATVISMSESTVTSPMMGRPEIIEHYTVETNDLVLELDYSFHRSTKPDEADQPGKNSPPRVPLGEATKIAISGHTAYVLDMSGAEVKMHIKKKMRK